MSDMSETEWIQPWSALLMRSKISKEAVESFVELTDSIIKDTNSESWGHRLAGQIENELTIGHEALVNHEIYKDVSAFDYIIQYINKYASQALAQYATSQQIKPYSEQSWKTVMNSCWVVSQQPGEYNPIHTHTDCNISGVFYIKVPEFEPAVKIKPEQEKIGVISDSDGCIVFSGRSGAGQSESLIKNNFTWKPRAGDIFVFPSYLAHFVYPYRCSNGDPERRSISFNADFMTEAVFREKYGK